ncbi:MAG: type II 3-dehydroquinate dehydratase [bacterium]|nr:type II 3-dehydroquinate dehydratase [bacterium]
MKKIIVINGPNLNLLGERQPEVYGKTTLPELERRLKKCGKSLGYQIDCFQFNSEGDIVDCVQKYRKGVAGIVMNPAGYSHTSIVILDALLAVEVPVVEVHISNIYKREEFRRKSITAAGCAGLISGLGITGYELAIQYIANTAKG